MGLFDSPISKAALDLTRTGAFGSTAQKVADFLPGAPTLPLPAPAPAAAPAASAQAPRGAGAFSPSTWSTWLRKPVVWAIVGGALLLIVFGYCASTKKD